MVKARSIGGIMAGPVLAFAIMFPALLAGSGMAQARMWLAAADPAQQARGPEAARGAVIWSHGRSVDVEDSEAPSPPYLAALRDAGWDVFRFNRLRSSDTLTQSAAGLGAQAGALKARGYRQVVLAGQSFGAFLSLMAADESDAVDAVVATAPAAFGDFNNYYGSWREN